MRAGFKVLLVTTDDEFSKETGERIRELTGLDACVKSSPKDAVYKILYHDIDCVVIDIEALGMMATMLSIFLSQFRPMLKQVLVVGHQSRRDHAGLAQIPAIIEKESAGRTLFPTLCFLSKRASLPGTYCG